MTHACNPPKNSKILLGRVSPARIPMKQLAWPGQQQTILETIEETLTDLIQNLLQTFQIQSATDSNDILYHIKKQRDLNLAHYAQGTTSDPLNAELHSQEDSCIGIRKLESRSGLQLTNDTTDEQTQDSSQNKENHRPSENAGDRVLTGFKLGGMAQQRLSKC